MSRSSWKSVYKDIKLQNFIKNLKNKKLNIQTQSRSLLISPDMVNYTFLVHNGNSYRKLVIHSKMVGHKLGEFSPTRKKPIIKKKKKKKR